MRRTGASLAALAVMTWGGAARATSMVKLDTNQLVDASDLVIRGTVTAVWADQDAEGLIWTHASVHVDEVLKGHPTTTEVVVDHLGGTVGPMAAEVPGMPRFDVGEDDVFFTELLGSGHRSVVGGSQGKAVVQFDPRLRTEVINRYQVPPTLNYDHRFLPLPDPAVAETLVSLKATVAARVVTGWDGQTIPGATPEHLAAISPPQPIEVTR